MEYIREDNGIYVKDGKKNVGEITYHIDGDTAVIDHTYVDDAYRGIGIASTLVEKAVADIREKDLNIDATCWYARKWLDLRNM